MLFNFNYLLGCIRSEATNKINARSQRIFGAVALLLPSLLPAQYIVHSWESFENALPATLRPGHDSKENSLQHLLYSTPGVPANLNTGLAQLHCGRGGLMFVTREGAKHLSVLSSASMDRGRLGAEGRALYQFDLFYPGPKAAMPNTAVLAVDTSKDVTGKSYVMYRFGIAEGGKKTYFSFTNGGPAPAIYKNAPLPQDLTVGWHRLQMIFEGNDTIHCAIDGEPVSYSPIKESSLRALTPGIMVAATPNRPLSVLTDNLSIQWTSEDVPPPDSPWVKASAEAAITADSLFSVHPGVTWLEDPAEAWKVCAQQKRPILAMFYSPKVSHYKYLLQIAPSDGLTRDELSRYVLLKVDANQLSGGTVAQRFKVSRLPTFVVLNAAGQEVRRLGVAANVTNWSEIQDFLAAP